MLCAGESDCNLPQLGAIQGQRARFHIFTLGTEDDLHSPNIAATTFVDNVRQLPGHACCVSLSRISVAAHILQLRTEAESSLPEAMQEPYDICLTTESSSCCSGVRACRVLLQRVNWNLFRVQCICSLHT